MYKEQPTPELLPYPELEAWLKFELKKQYQEQINSYRQNNLLELNPETGETGIYGTDDQFYAYPDLKAIEQAIRANQEFYQLKLKQGLTELEIVPFALPLT